MGQTGESDHPEGEDLPGAAGGGLGAPSELGDALRTAVERTLAATADSATETRQRAQTLLDEVVRRGGVARGEVARRGEEATNLLGGAINDLRTTDGDELRRLSDRLEALEARLARLEARSEGHSDRQVEPERSASGPLGQRDSR